MWHWNDKQKTLEKYLDEAEVVGIGGLVTRMRAKDERMLKDLEKLCLKYPNRFHVFGMNWLKTIEILRGVVASADTSKFLDGLTPSHPGTTVPHAPG